MDLRDSVSTTNDHPKVIRGVGGSLTKTQGTWRLETIWPKVWSSMSHGALKKAKQQWETEEPKLQDARQTRDIMIFFLAKLEILTSNSQRQEETVGCNGEQLDRQGTDTKSCSVCRATFSDENSKANTNVRISKVCSAERDHSHEDQLANRGCHSWHHWFTRPYPPAKL